MRTARVDPFTGRLVVLIACFGVLFALVGARLLLLQGIEGSQWERRAAALHERTVPLEPERGTIFDRAGRVLAISVEVPSIYVIPSAISDPAAVSYELAEILGESHRTMLSRIASPKSFVWIARKVEPERAAAVERLGAEGIGQVAESKRFYPKRALLGQAIGFAGIDQHGLEGIEKRFDRHLRGERAWLVLERDAHGRPVSRRGAGYLHPLRGSDIMVTIDELIQYIAERELERAIASTKASAGVIIVMEPRSGEILALAVRPSFNPNAVSFSRPDEWRNRAVTDVYEPGSVFKIVTASAALEEQVVRPEEEIDCEQGSALVGGAELHDHHPLGVLTFKDVIAHSSNICTAKVAMRLGEERLARYISLFGFGEKGGIDLIGEAPGIVHDVEQWSKRSLPTMAIGQEVAVTPLQMATAASVVANGGWLVVPRLIREIRGPEGKGVERFESAIRRRVISPATASAMTEILEGVVTHGTGKKGAIAGYRVAGKTGTAQKIDRSSGAYSPDRFVSSFVGFLPADDPQATILVVIDEPKGISWGGDVAAPVFRAVGEDLLRYRKVAPR